VPFRSPIARPFRADAGSAGEPDSPVDDEDASVITLVRPAEADDREQAQRTQRAERGDLAARARHRLAVLRRHLAGPEAVQQDVRADPRPAAIGQRLRDLAADGALHVEILRVGDRLARRADRRQLGGKDLIAVQQHLHGVAAADRRDGIGLDGRNERGVGDRQLRHREMGRHASARSRREADEGHADERQDALDSDLYLPRSFDLTSRKEHRQVDLGPIGCRDRVD